MHIEFQAGLVVDKHIGMNSMIDQRRHWPSECLRTRLSYSYELGSGGMVDSDNINFRSY